MNARILGLAVLVAVVGLLISACSKAQPDAVTKRSITVTSTKSIHDIPVQSIDGEELTLDAFAGKVLLIVNVASKCGYTPQYEGLEKLYREYKDQGFSVLGFPANDFLWQEPGTNEEIKSFCSTTYGVTFPMFAKIHVKGRKQHPLYQFLTGKETNPEHAGRITWNFNKFLIGRDGHVLNRFGTRTPPDDPDLIKAVESALNDSATGSPRSASTQTSPTTHTGA